MHASAPHVSPSFRLLSIILVLLFAGAVVGETVALSMIVSVAGSGVIGKLYLVNGLLLFLLPLLFFDNIDRVNRGRLLSFLLVSTCGVLALQFIALKAGAGLGAGFSSVVLLSMYPLAYLSKTVLFLTFWTLANDVCGRGEAKIAFPRVAAWGLLGGLCGAWIARLLLEVVEAETVVVVWMGAYLAGLVFSRRITQLYRVRLMKKEQVPRGDTSRTMAIVGQVRDVLEIELVRLIAVFYFFVFVAVFSLDYLFWHACHEWFVTSRSLAAFQFTFYIAHGLATVIGLRFVMPMAVQRWGFPRIFALLPLVLFSGAVSLLVMLTVGVGVRMAFAGLIVLQFARYVSFENAFSPVYQMFFASISRDKRGRAKTVLEGVIKPSAIIIAGLVLLAFRSMPGGVLAIVLLSAAAMILVVRRLRETYLRGLVPKLSSVEQPDEVLVEIGSRYDQKILSLIREYSRSEDADMRGLAVKVLAHSGSRQALGVLAEIYRAESRESVKEMVARSLTDFYWYDTKELVEQLLRDHNPRIRSNAIYSLCAMNSHWKWRLHDQVKGMLFDDSIRVRIEAARFLWQTRDRGDRKTVLAYLASLLESRNASKRSAGLYLVGSLKPSGWEGLLLNELRTTSFQVYARCVDVIFGSASHETRMQALRIVQSLSRAHIAEAGRAIRRAGLSAKQAVEMFLQEAASRRLVFELVQVLRAILDSSAGSGQGPFLDQQTEVCLRRWITAELEGVYRDCVAWESYRSENVESIHELWMICLEDALRERLLRIAGWALDTLALLERRRGVSWGKRDWDVHERTDRLDMAEVLESYSAGLFGALVVPILRVDKWNKMAAIGRQRFAHDDEVEARPLAHLVRCENKWVSLCALYCVSHSPDGAEVIRTEREILAARAGDAYTYLARGARTLLGEAQRDEGSMRDSFELLETVLFFKKTLLFRNVPAEKLMGLAEISVLVSYARNSIVSKEGDISDHLYVVRSGSLKIVKVKNAVKTILSIVRSGEAYGEIGLLNQAPRSATAVANEDCQLYVVQRASLKKLLMEMPEIAYNLLELFSEKLRRSGEEVALLHTTLSSRMHRDTDRTSIA